MGIEHSRHVFRGVAQTATLTVCERLLHSAQLLFSIDFIISECSINSAFERVRTIMKTLNRGLPLEHCVGIGRRGCAERPGLQFLGCQIQSAALPLN